MNEKVVTGIAKLIRGCVEVLPTGELAEKLASKKKLRVKLGMDPTSPHLHLGHILVLEKLKDFQEQGHHVIFVIGDFTALIGDPTGKSKTRPALSAEQITHNAQTYFDQVSKILDRSKTEVRYNSEWLSSLDLSTWVKIAAKTTLARLVERNDFQNRLASAQAIGFHELFYPLLQAYDSVMLEADVELGGTDQTFNLLMGRHLQEEYGQDPQVVMTMPLLEGLDGVHKMSKSLGNDVGVTEEPKEAFGKLMSISDELMWRYYELLLCVSTEDVEHMKMEAQSGQEHPLDLKKNMAFQIITKYWSEKQAHEAREHFEQVFQNKNYEHADIVEITIPKDQEMWIVDLLKVLDVVKTSSEAKRLVQAGAVHIDDKRIIDFKAMVSVRSGMVVRAGKHHIFKIEEKA